MNAWEWFVATASVDSLLTTLGLSALALLFARDLILTKAQHLRRVQDITAAHDLRVTDLLAHHSRELAEKDRHLANVVESRDKWEQATRIERERADKATGAIGEMATAQTRLQHVLESLNSALLSPRGGNDEHSR